MKASGLPEEADPEPAKRIEISLQNPNRYAEVRDAGVEVWLERLLLELAPDTVSFVVRFVGDRAIRGFNREYRDIDRPTDVLSFPGEDGPEGLHLGDVAISVPTARRQAVEAGRPVDRELRMLLLHGVLHCLGYDHETDDGEMRILEERLRRSWVERVV
ncbi:MAG: rRNA maturation RNase YbeY [Acidobacteriota bacterium]|nr:rRNA maturation RNase YbeY [Acidobacteriota bacterium]